MKLDLFEAVSHLRAEWSALTDIDRSIRIKPILAAGMKQRTLARAVKCSEALIRHLVVAADAYPEEQLQAGAGLISTRELVRRVRYRRQRQADFRREQVERDRDRAIVQATELICSFLDRQGIPASFAERVILEAVNEVRFGEEHQVLPERPLRPGVTPDIVIDALRPPAPQQSTMIGMVPFWAAWLAHVVVSIHRDSIVRESAFQSAWDRMAAH